MIGKKVIAGLIALSVFSIVRIQGQDVVYSQFYANPLYLNPALAGATLSPRIAANYRNQWPSLQNAFTTYGISYDQYVDAISGAFGVSINSDRIVNGLMSSTSAYLMYSYRLRASRKISINLALAGGIYQNSLDWNAIELENQPAQMPVGKTSNIKPDFNFGTVMGYKNVFYAGVALAHLSQPIISFDENGLDKLHIKYTFHVGGNIFAGGMYNQYSDFPPKVVFSPALVYIRQGIYQQVALGINTTIYPFTIGMWYRNNIKNSDAVIVLLGFQFYGFQFGYSYDITISKFTNATGGAHEISLGYRFKESKLSKRTIEKQKEIPCPRF
jgi:type IX secretion system PorP/SprF family membrane protein